MRIFFEPADFMFFRDNKPFTGGESFSGLSMNLPLPQVIYGALRTFLLQQAGVDFSRFAAFKTIEEGAAAYPVVRLTGLPAVDGTLRIRGPYLARYNSHTNQAQVYFPTPLDVLKFERKLSEDNSKSLYTLLQPQPEGPTRVNLPAAYLQPLLPKPDLNRDTEEPGNLVFSRTAMREYLDGSLERRRGNDENVLPLEDFVKPEGRIGIAISPNWVTQSGQFYLLEGRRFAEETGLVVDVDGIAPQEAATLNGQMLHLGGERRFGRLVGLSGLDIPPAAPADLERKFKLVLTTPALFGQGWLPGWLDHSSGQGQLPGSDLTVQLVAAAVGRPVVLSGFDVARSRPKAIRRAVPAGSVYYFELVKGDPARLVELFHHANSISDEDGQAGFGLALVGKW